MVLMLIVRGAARAEQVGPLQRGVVDRVAEPAGARQQQAAGRDAARRRPGTAGWRSAAPRCRRRARAACRSSGGSRPAASCRSRAPGRAPRRPRCRRPAAARSGGQAQRALAQRRPAFGVARDVVVVEPVVDDQLVHQRRAPARRRCRAAARCAGGTSRPSRCGADRCRSASRPARLACCAKVQKCRLEVIELLPQMRISRLSAKCSTCMPTLRAVGRGQRLAAGGGADGAVEQRGAEPVEEARRHALALHQAHGAGVAVGHDRPAGSPRPAMAFSRAAMSASASSQLTRSNRPLPLGPTRRSGCSTRSAW